MNIVAMFLKVLPYLLALVTISAVLLTGMAGVRLFQQKMDKTTLLLGILGVVCLLAAIISWRALFNYWKTGAGL